MDDDGNDDLKDEGEGTWLTISNTLNLVQEEYHHQHFLFYCEIVLYLNN